MAVSSVGRGRKLSQCDRPGKELKFHHRWESVLRGTMGEASSQWVQFRQHHDCQAAIQIGPLHSSDPMMGGPAC